MSAVNLAHMFSLADKTDYQEGLLAYERYHKVMCDLSALYDVQLPRVVAGFVSLSPNNDYYGNARSLVSILVALRQGVPLDLITVSSYKHCRDRAYAYVSGTREFLAGTKGLKVLSFYHNILNPTDHRYVTVDGHMVAAYRGDDTLTMKEAIIRHKPEYHAIADAVKRLAFREFILPNQYQAIIWFVRKRVCRVRYNPQSNLFDWANGDLWRTYLDVSTIKPYLFTGETT